jgi:hypothetical protein
MQCKTLIVPIAIAIIGVSSAAMARAAGGGKGWSGSGHFDHSHFVHDRFDNRFPKNQVLLNGWGWDWGWGSPLYDYSGYGSTTVVPFPQAIPQAADVTGSVAAGPCTWNQQAFTVPSSAGGTRQVQVVSCH